MLTLAEAGIELKFRRLHNGVRVIDLRRDPADASLSYNPKDASPDPEPEPQTALYQELT